MYALLNQKGVTLIEIMLSIVILGLIATPIFAFFTGSFMNIIILGERAEKLAFASRTLDELRALLEDIDDGLSEGKIQQELEALRISHGGFDFRTQKLPENHQAMGTIVTMEVFMQNGDEGKSIVLTSLIRGADGE